MIEKYPLKLIPCYKSYMWGGNQLERIYGKKGNSATIAESWELACRSDGMCFIKNGIYSGQSLDKVLKLHPDYIGFWRGKFPLLVKLIDAKEDLSVQVHPSDITARKELGEEGKAEMWYVVSAESQAILYCGLKREITVDELITYADNGTICELLNQVPVKAGDVIFIQPGTIHAIGKGLLIAEIQQNSNTTFRIYDYLRRDAQGQQRPLHLNRAAEVVDLTPTVPTECKANLQMYFSGYRLLQMFSCPCFDAYKLELAYTISLFCSRESFTHLLVISGNAILCTKKGSWTIHSGDSWFLPAGLGKYTLSGQCVVLLSKLNEEAHKK